MAIFEDESPSSRHFSREDYSELRKVFDGDEENVFHGMGIVAPRPLKKLYRAEQDNPRTQFLYNDDGTQKFLLKTFPLWKTDAYQKLQAGRWAAVISLYFRQGLSDSTIEKDLDWKSGTVGYVVQQIRRKIEGVRCNGKAYSARKPGRPKVAALPAPDEAPVKTPKGRAA